LSFATFISTRTSVLIDNLYFGAVSSVPEPGSLALLVAGLGVVGVARRRWRRHLPQPDETRDLARRRPPGH
jgi:hypothetical protein